MRWETALANSDYARVKLVLFGQSGKVDPEQETGKTSARSLERGSMDIKSSLDKQGVRWPSEEPRGEKGSMDSKIGVLIFRAIPQGISSRNCMEASETGGCNETIWY